MTLRDRLRDDAPLDPDSARALLGALDPAASDAPACDCTVEYDGGVLTVRADDCPFDGRLARAPDCRERAVTELDGRRADAVRVRLRGRERRYAPHTTRLLAAAGRYAARVDHSVAARLARRDPLAAARLATGARAALADRTGLTDAAARDDPYAARVGPTLALARVDPAPPPAGALSDTAATTPETTARRYERPDALPVYHLDPPETGLDAADCAVLDAATDRLVADGERPDRAVAAVCDDPERVAPLARVLRKHTRGYGVLDDLFADPRVTDVFAPAPADHTPLYVRCDGDRHETNVTLTAAGARALASRFRADSGRAFSGADPVLDAVADDVAGRRVRVAGVTGPASDGPGFAFRAHGGDGWTLPELVANGTLPADAAALCSLAVARGAAVLVAGPRGAGKTTLLGALLRELPRDVRTVVVEDTPELPVDTLREDGRDVQALRTALDGDGLAPDEALRTALRLGEGALVVGEVRGREAETLYEAMRVGAHASAVLGTIHGEDGASVRERVVSDLGVPASSFAATDIVVTTGRVDGDHRVVRIEAYADDEFRALYELDGTRLVPAGSTDAILASLARPGEPIDDVRDARRERTVRLRPDSSTAVARTDGGSAEP